ncbi:hypothetical protein Godav_003655 [Gossypium davidsonii]|uniref:Uncharacterized protein n=2 Tax=Gossypium TaxID=3633 RepID=A0A7J8SIL6_GOSDV|nr:hypothetical protein [Gossypium davidsonii]MBA0661488.1 hypothetical protein [Gossypium klotzschianum]
MHAKLWLLSLIWSGCL